MQKTSHNAWAKKINNLNEPISYIDFLNKLKVSINPEDNDILFELCPRFTANYTNNDPIQLMMELIELRNNMLNKNIYDCSSGLRSVLLSNVYINNKTLNLEQAIMLFYEEEPEVKKFIFFDPIIKKINTIDDNIEKMEIKLKTIEQFQAQILDKLTVFSEMIDNIQELLNSK